jgi:hypothetical protein
LAASLCDKLHSTHQITPTLASEPFDSLVHKTYSFNEEATLPHLTLKFPVVALSFLGQTKVSHANATVIVVEVKGRG